MSLRNNSTSTALKTQQGDAPAFAGFKSPKSNFTMVPNQFFDAVVRGTSLCVLQVVLCLIQASQGRHDPYTGERRLEADLPLSKIAAYCNSLSSARRGIAGAIQAGYIVETLPATNHFATRYALRWEDVEGQVEGIVRQRRAHGEDGSPRPGVPVMDPKWKREDVAHIGQMCVDLMCVDLMCVELNGNRSDNWSEENAVPLNCNSGKSAQSQEGIFEGPGDVNLTPPRGLNLIPPRGVKLAPPLIRENKIEKENKQTNEPSAPPLTAATPQPTLPPPPEQPCVEEPLPLQAAPPEPAMQAVQAEPIMPPEPLPEETVATEAVSEETVATEPQTEAEREVGLLVYHALCACGLSQWAAKNALREHGAERCQTVLAHIPAECDCAARRSRWAQKALAEGWTLTAVQEREERERQEQARLEEARRRHEEQEQARQLPPKTPGVTLEARAAARQRLDTLPKPERERLQALALAQLRQEMPVMRRQLDAPVLANGMQSIVNVRMAELLAAQLSGSMGTVP